MVKHSSSHSCWFHAWNHSTNRNKLCITVALLIKWWFTGHVLAYLRRWRWRPPCVGSYGQWCLGGSTATGCPRPLCTARHPGGCSQSLDQTGPQTEPAEPLRTPGSCTPPRHPPAPSRHRRPFPSCRCSKARRGPSICCHRPPVAGTEWRCLLWRKSTHLCRWCSPEVVAQPVFRPDTTPGKTGADSLLWERIYPCISVLLWDIMNTWTHLSASSTQWTWA